MGMAAGEAGILSFKKDDPCAPSRIVPDVHQSRPHAMEKRSNLAQEAKRLIFIDETSYKTNMTRLQGDAGGRTIGGQGSLWPLEDEFTTFIAALGIQGMRCSTVVDGAVNAEVFETFVGKVLVPELRGRGCGGAR